jgi:hypothetical protein
VNAGYLMSASEYKRTDTAIKHIKYNKHSAHTSISVIPRYSTLGQQSAKRSANSVYTDPGGTQKRVRFKCTSIVS